MMVNANIDNMPVSIQLNNGESTTVPSGETWKVTIQASAYSNDNCGVKINGTRVISLYSYENASFETVLTSGDTVSVQAGRSADGAHIGGFVV